MRLSETDINEDHVDEPNTKGFLPLTPVTFHMLLSLMDQARHGYGIKREVEDPTSGAIWLGAGTPI